MSSFKIGIAALSVLAATCGGALAGNVKVLVLPNSATPVDFLDTAPFIVPVDDQTTDVRIWHEDFGSGSIPSVFLSNTSQNPVALTLTLGSASPVLIVDPATIACDDFDGVTADTDVTISKLYGRIGGDLTGTVDVNEIHRLIVLGDIEATLRGHDPDAFNRIFANSITSTGAIELTDGDVETSAEFKINGDMAGAITLLNNSGTKGKLVSAYIVGDITSTGTITCTDFDQCVIDGNVAGTITCESWQRSVIDGSLSGTIDHTDVYGDVKDEFIRIGDHFLNPGQIKTPLDGIRSWIMIGRNASRNSLLNPMWQTGAKVVIGDPQTTGVELLSADYSQLPVELGGAGVFFGTVGLEKLGLHGEACSPAQGAVITDQSDFPSFISLRHYGLIDYDDPAGANLTPVQVLRRKIGASSWVIHTQSFTFALDPVHPNEADWTYFVRATPLPSYSFCDGFEYKVEVNESPGHPGRLICEASGDHQVWGLNGNGGSIIEGTESFLPPYSPEYTFQIDTGCPADLNHDGVVDTADLGILVGNYGSSGLCPPGDINGDGVVDTADLGILISQFDETCGAESLGGGGGGSVGSLLEEMGFDNLEEYIEWLGTLSAEEIVEHISGLIEGLESE